MFSSAAITFYSLIFTAINERKKNHKSNKVFKCPTCKLIFKYENMNKICVENL